MSKTIKRVASIALPVIGTLVAPGIGTAIGSSLGSTALGAIGGALGGAAGGLVSGGGLGGALKGAALGGAGGFVGSGGLGSAASAPAQAGSNAALQTAQQGSGVLGALSRTGLGSSLVRNISPLTSPSSLALGVGNTLVGLKQADAAEDAARLQAEAAARANESFRADTAPYRQLGQDAINQINEIQRDPAGYIRNNELYQSLAADAERRLLANQAAKGKVGSGGTAAALQEQLLNLGNSLVNQRINALQGQANTGAGAAGQTAAGSSDLITQQGNAQAAGQIGPANALSTAYQNQINTLLALQSLNKTPVYQPLNV